MTHCLGDRTLFLLSEGDGTTVARQHLAACADCTARYRRLACAADVAAQVLIESPWPADGTARPPAIRWGFLPAVALAATVALAWFGVLGRGSRPPTATGQRGVAVAALSLNDVSSTLFTVDDGVWRSEQDSDAEALRAALQGEWPCDGAERLLDAACD